MDAKTEAIVFVVFLFLSFIIAFISFSTKKLDCLLSLPVLIGMYLYFLALSEEEDYHGR